MAKTALIPNKELMPNDFYRAFAPLVVEGIEKGYITKTTISPLSEWNIKENDNEKLQD